MTVQFREKARIAYETMPVDLKKRASQVISLLDKDALDNGEMERINISKLKEHGSDIWVARLGLGSRLLFQKSEQGFLIIDIIDLSKEDYSAYPA